MLLADGVPPFRGALILRLGRRRSPQTTCARAPHSTTEIRQPGRLREAKADRYGCANPRELALTFCRIGFRRTSSRSWRPCVDVHPPPSPSWLFFKLSRTWAAGVARNGHPHIPSDTNHALVRRLKSYVAREKSSKGYRQDSAAWPRPTLHEGIRDRMTCSEASSVRREVEAPDTASSPVICSSAELNPGLERPFIHNAVQALNRGG